MSPEEGLAIDNLLADVHQVLAGAKDDRAQRASLAARLERIEQALKIPAVYSLREACARLGLSESWGHKHLDELPTPVKQKPLRFRVDDIEALVASAPRGRKRAS